MMSEPVPEWVQQITTHLGQLEQLLFDIPILREKTITNHNEIENICQKISAIKEHTRGVPQILELAIENYTKCEELSEKINTLEKSMKNLHSITIE